MLGTPDLHRGGQKKRIRDELKGLEFILRITENHERV